MSQSQSSNFLEKPAAVTASDNSGTVSLQLLPANGIVSLPSLSVASSSSSATSNRVALTGTPAVLAAFGLSLIPTLAVSIPFFLGRSRTLGPILGRSLKSDFGSSLLEEDSHLVF